MGVSQDGAPKQGRVTLAEVAERAGVSTTTVSLVLGGKADQHRISEETHRRVKQAADDLDYVPNLLVRSMQRGRTHVLSFFNGYRTQRMATDLYMDRLSTAIQNAAGQRGYDILVHCNFSRTARDTYRQVNGGRADGLLLFAPTLEDPLLPYLRASRLPVVLVNAEDPHRVLPSVRDDVESGMRQVAEALVRGGHQRIAVVTEAREHVDDAHARIRLLRRYLAEAGVAIPDEWVIPYGAGEALRGFLQRPERPTALFCWRDRIAYFALEICESVGISVPEELSIVGYDGLPWPAATRHTAASVYVDLEGLAASAVELLDKYVNGYRGEVTQWTLPVTLTSGTTLGPAPSPGRAERRQL